MSILLILEIIYVAFMTAVLFIILVRITAQRRREKETYIELQYKMEMLHEKRFETREEASYALQELRFPLGYYIETEDTQPELNRILIKLSLLYDRGTKS